MLRFEGSFKSTRRSLDASGFRYHLLTQMTYEEPVDNSTETVGRLRLQLTKLEEHILMAILLIRAGHDAMLYQKLGTIQPY